MWERCEKKRDCVLRSPWSANAPNCHPYLDELLRDEVVLGTVDELGTAEVEVETVEVELETGDDKGTLWRERWVAVSHQIKMVKC